MYRCERRRAHTANDEFYSMCWSLPSRRGAGASEFPAIQESHTDTSGSKSEVDVRTSRDGFWGQRQIDSQPHHLAESVISVVWPPFRSIVSSSVCWLAAEGFGWPRRTYRPGGTSPNEI